MVGIPKPETRLKSFPHQFSGGMRQRVMIAMALALEPRLLIADEPTTALDVTIQAQVLELIKDLTAKTGTAVILITHDLGVVAGMTQRINVMYAGFIVETATTGDLFAALGIRTPWASCTPIPRLDAVRAATALIPIEGAPPDQRGPDRLPLRPRCRWRPATECWTGQRWRSRRSRPGHGAHRVLLNPARPHAGPRPLANPPTPRRGGAGRAAPTRRCSWAAAHRVPGSARDRRRRRRAEMPVG